MFCHTISKTYLEKWKIKDKKDSIYVFNKNNLSNQGEIRDLTNLTKTELGYTNYYYLKIEDCDHKIFDNMFQDLIDEINKQYILKFNKLEIKTATQFRLAYLKHEDKLKIYRRDNNVEIKLSRINKLILDSWNISKKRYIEDFFSKEIENDWQKVVNEFETIIKTKAKLSKFAREKLILFIATQINRNHKKHNEKIKITQNDEILKKILIVSIYEFIKIYNHEQEDNNDNYIFETYKQLKKTNLHITILHTESSFITTDNPIITYKHNHKDSILIPITPNICLIIQNSLIESLSIKKINSIETKKINNELINNAINNIVYFDKIITELY
ncbi:MAG: DUF4238 domain-containing protein [Bacilli bacterium]|nr:DUF4238 domain-containing protein [Bacilli bacterium]